MNVLLFEFVFVTSFFFFKKKIKKHKDSLLLLLMYNNYYNISYDVYEKVVSDYNYMCMIACSLYFIFGCLTVLELDLLLPVYKKLHFVCLIGSSFMFYTCIWLQLTVGFAIKNISDIQNTEERKAERRGRIFTILSDRNLQHALVFDIAPSLLLSTFLVVISGVCFMNNFFFNSTNLYQSMFTKYL